jgi:hypothetical protein
MVILLFFFQSSLLFHDLFEFFFSDQLLFWLLVPKTQRTRVFVVVFVPITELFFSLDRLLCRLLLNCLFGLFDLVHSLRLDSINVLFLDLRLVDVKELVH